MKKSLFGLSAIAMLFFLMLTACASQCHAQANEPMLMQTHNIYTRAQATPVLKGKTASGIYKKTSWNKDFSESFFSDSNVTGITLLMYWQNMNPAPGVYDWKRLDAQAAACAKYDKKIALNIGTGCRSPKWVLSKCRLLRFNEFHHVASAADDRPITYDQPVVWDAAYTTAITNFIAALAAHCQQQPYWSNISIVSDGGVSRTTEELRLPCLNKVTIGRYTSTDAPALWATVGYTPDKVIAAFKLVTDAWIKGFPRRVISLSYINGDCFISGTPDVFNACAVYLQGAIGDKAIFKYTSLTDSYAGSKRASFLMDMNANMGAQLAENVYSEMAAKDSASLRIALDKALLYQMQFVEMDWPTVDACPDLIYTYNKLIK